MEPVEIRLKRKYRYTANGRFEGGENYAKPKRKRLGLGPKTYDPKKHYLLLQPSGKTVMVHLP